MLYVVIYELSLNARRGNERWRLRTIRSADPGSPRCGYVVRPIGFSDLNANEDEMTEYAARIASSSGRSRPYPSAARSWLRECHGFRVDSPAGRVGLVEELLGEHDGEFPSVLLVRSGRLGRRLLPIAADQVADIVPRERRLLLAATPGLAAPDLVDGLQPFGVPIGLGERGAGTGPLRGGMSPPQRRPRTEFRCADCGYGAVAEYEPPRCPLCGGSSWQSVGP